MQPEVRLFVSSTFRDLQPERDALVRQCFPQVRQRFAKAGTGFVEIDLRWGLQLGESEERIVQLCLDEVQRCAGYFVGILGNRYGYVPQSQPPPPTPARAMAWPLGASITEYEIRAGAFVEPAPRFVRFYFKQPQEQPDEPALQRLKQEILRRGFTVRHFAQPQELAALMLQDLAGLADDLACHSATAAEEVQRQLALISRATTPRSDVERALDGWLAGGPRRALLTGPVGSGKTTLLSAWMIRRMREPLQSRPTPAWRRWVPGTTASNGPPLWIVYLAGAQAGEARFRRLLDHTQAQLPSALQGLAVETAGTPLAQRLLLWHQALARALQHPTELVLVVDGVDELGLDPVLPFHWLPPDHPRLRVLLSARHPGLGACEPVASWPHISVGVLDPAERRLALFTYLQDFGKTLPDAAAERLAVNEALANPSSLRLLADELRLLKTPEHVLARIAEAASLSSARALATELLIRLEEELGADLVALVCRLLLVSRGGLPEGDLRAAAAARRQTPAWQWSALMQSFRRSVFDQQGRLALFDANLRQAAQDRYLVDAGSEAAARETLVASYQAAPDRDACAPRALEEVPWQLWKAQRWDALRSLFSQPQKMAACWRLEPDLCRQMWQTLIRQLGRKVLAEVAQAWQSPGGAAQVQPQEWAMLAMLMAELGAVDEAVALAATRADASAAAAQAPNQAARLQRFSLLAATAQLMVQAGQLSHAQAVLDQIEAFPLAELPPTLQAVYLNARGNWHLQQGQHEAALSCHTACGQLHASQGDMWAVAQSQHNQALALLQAGQPAAAVKRLQGCAKAFEQLHDLRSLAATQLQLACAEERAGNLKAALRWVALPEATARAGQQLAELTQALAVRARLAELVGDRDEAERCQLERQQLCQCLGDADGELDALLGRVAIRLNLGPRGLGSAAALLQKARAQALADSIQATGPTARPATRARLQQLEQQLHTPGTGTSNLDPSNPSERG